MFYMQQEGCGKAAEVVNFVAKWLNLYPYTVLHLATEKQGRWQFRLGQIEPSVVKNRKLKIVFVTTL